MPCPRCSCQVVLAAIVLISIVKLVDYHEALFLWRVSKRDFLVFATIFLCTVFLGAQTRGARSMTRCSFLF